MAVLAAAVVTVLGAGADQPAQAAVACDQAPPLVVNTGGSSARALVTYDVQGHQRSSVPLGKDYGDVAVDRNGTLYGVVYGVPTPTLDTIDAGTGAVLASRTFAGPSGVDYNALSALPGGDLLVGVAFSATVHRVVPTTGATSVFATLPTGWASAGDFLSLADGDVLAVAENGTDTALMRITPAGVVTGVGTVPSSYGAAQSGGRIYLAGANGDLYSLASVPTVASTAPLPVTTVGSTGQPFYGATSIGDAGLCARLTTGRSPTMPSGTPVRPGQPVTYTLTFDNTTGQAVADLDWTYDLDGVLDDATLTVAPTPSPGSALVVGALTGSPRRFTVTGTVPAGTSATVTYTVVADRPSGDAVLVDHLVPTGTSIPAGCVSGDDACTAYPVGDVSSTTSAGPAPAAGAGLALTWTTTVVNGGPSVLGGVGATATGFTGTGPAPVATCPSTSLPVGAALTCTWRYTATAADVRAGAVTLTATAHGSPPGATSPLVTAEQAARVALAQVAAAPVALATTGVADAVVLTAVGTALTLLGAAGTVLGRRRRV